MGPALRQFQRVIPCIHTSESTLKVSWCLGGCGSVTPTVIVRLSGGLAVQRGLYARGAVRGTPGSGPFFAPSSAVARTGSWPSAQVHCRLELPGVNELYAPSGSGLFPSDPSKPLPDDASRSKLLPNIMGTCIFETAHQSRSWTANSIAKLNV